MAAYLVGEAAWLLALPLLAAAGAPGLPLSCAALLRLPAAGMCAISLKLLRLLPDPAPRIASLLLIPLIPIGLARAAAAAATASSLLSLLLPPRGGGAVVPPVVMGW